MHEVVDSAFSFKSGINHILDAIDICDFDMNSDGRVGWIAGEGFASFSCFSGPAFVAICKDDSNSTGLSEGESCVFSYSARSL